MPDVFVSYSRRDGEFVRRLSDSIAQRGKEVWLDTEGIEDAELFPAAIKRAIESSDAFLFVITPSSVESKYCGNEVEYARDLQKRIVPVLREPVPDEALAPEIRDRNWVPFTTEPEFDPGVERVIHALDTDLEAARAHTRWLTKAIDWQAAQRDRSFLLRGAELKAAEGWLASSPANADPAPTPLQREYLLASRNAAARRQRALVGVSAAVALISVGLLIFALISRQQAVSERVAARAQAFAAESQAQIANDPEISVILAARAVREKSTPQTRFALRAALDASPLEVGLPTITNPGSCGVNLGLDAVYSPDGAQIAEGACTGLLRLLDARTGRVLRSVNLGSPIATVAYSPAGSTLAAATSAGVVLLDPVTGAVRMRLAGGAGASSLAFSADGTLLAADDRAGTTVWRLPGGQARVLTPNQTNAGPIAFTPDDRTLIVGAGGAPGQLAVHVYDVATGRLIHQILPPNQAPWPTEVIALSRDGRQLAVGYPIYPRDGTGRVSIYDTVTWRKTADIATDLGVETSAVAFSPDGTRVAIGNEDGTSSVWSVATDQRIASFDGPTTAVDSMEFSPDGTSVLTASGDGIARIWRATGGARSFSTVSLNTGANQVALSGGRTEVTSVSDGVVASTPISGGPSQTLRLGGAAGASLSPDGRLALAHGPSYGPPSPMVVWNLASGKPERTLPPAVFINAVFSPDDSRLLLQLPVKPDFSVVKLVVMTLATGRTVQLQLPRTNSCGNPSQYAAFSRDDRFVTNEYFCGIAVVWNAATGKIVRTVNQGGEISGVDLTHDGSRLLVSSWDSRATIWSVATGRPLMQLVGHTGGIAAAAFSPDGSTVLTSGLDSTVRLWRASTGAPLRVLRFPVYQDPVGFSPDGRLLVTVDGEAPPGTPFGVRVFDTCPSCQDRTGLLNLAARGTTTHLTDLERTVVGQS